MCRAPNTMAIFLCVNRCRSNFKRCLHLKSRVLKNQSRVLKNQSRVPKNQSRGLENSSSPQPRFTTLQHYNITTFSTFTPLPQGRLLWVIIIYYILYNILLLNLYTYTLLQIPLRFHHLSSAKHRSDLNVTML